MSTRRSWITAVVLALSGLFLLLVPPLVLYVLSKLPFDWDVLSSIGQSYTGVATGLSAAAVLAATYTFLVSRRQEAEQARINLRTMQFQLRVLALSHPDLAESVQSPRLPPAPGAEPLSQRQTTYIAMWLNYLAHGYTSGVLTADEVREVVAGDILGSSIGMENWRQIRHGWRTSSIFSIVDEEYDRRAEAS